ncbi:MAG: hypothetical protein J7513_01140 [Solirubrobacteraceae bacterium]|nr:hypothetical protein [Solirubrobacteraceae bacterium]
MRVLLGQVAIAAGDQAANVATVVEALDAYPDADLAVFPEMTLPGYDTTALDRDALTIAADAGLRDAEPAPGDGARAPGDGTGPPGEGTGPPGEGTGPPGEGTWPLPTELAAIAQAAARCSTAVVVGFAERAADGTFRNSVACLDERGDLAGVYRKTHLFGDGETSAFVAGEEYVLVTLVGVRVGVQICFDTEFPEPARAMALGGAELLVTASANMAPYELEHRLGAAARAIENRTPHVYVNRCGHESGFEFLGDSAAIDAGGRDLLRLGASPELAVVDVPIGAATVGEVDYLRLLTPPLPLRDATRTSA